MARIKNCGRKTPRSLSSSTIKATAGAKRAAKKKTTKNRITNQRPKKRHAVAGQASVDWKNHSEMRVFIYVLRTRFNFNAELNAEIFTEAFHDLLDKWGFTEGMPVQSLRDQWNQRRADKRPTKIWDEIESNDQTAENLALRDGYEQQIKRIANEISMERDGTLMFDSVEEVEEDTMVPEDEALADPQLRQDEQAGGQYAEHEDETMPRREDSEPWLDYDIEGNLNQNYVRDEMDKIQAEGSGNSDPNGRISNSQLIVDLNIAQNSRNGPTVNMAFTPDDSPIDPNLTEPGRYPLLTIAASSQANPPTTSTLNETNLATNPATNPANNSSRPLQTANTNLARPTTTISTRAQYRGIPYSHKMPLQDLNPKDRTEGTEADPIYSTKFANDHPHIIWYQRGRGWAPGLPPNQDGKVKIKQHIRLPKDIVLAPGWWRRGSGLKRENPTYDTTTAASIDQLLPDRNDIRRSKAFRLHGRIERDVIGTGSKRIDGLNANEDDRASQRRGARGRGGRVLAADNTGDEDEDDTAIVPLPPRPVYGATEANAYLNQSRQAVGAPASGVGQMASYAQRLPQLATAPAVTSNLPLGSISGNQTYQATTKPDFIDAAPLGQLPMDRQAQPAHLNAYRRTNAFENSPYQPSTAQTNMHPNHQPTAPFPRAYPLPPATTTNNQNTISPHQQISTLPEFLQPRVAIQPWQTRGFTVDQAYVLDHMECDWEFAENDNGTIRYKVIENEKMWKARDDYRLSLR